MQSEALLDALLHVPFVAGARVSPDGRWVAWTWVGAGTSLDVYAARTDGESPPLRLTKSPADVRLVGWAPDSSSVLVQHDHEGDERMRIFRVTLDQPGVMEPLTEAEPNFFIRGGQLHSNGRWLIYAANVDEHGDEIEQSCIYRQDIGTGERTLLARPEKGGYIIPQINDQGTHILYNRLDRNPAGMQVWMVDIDGQGDREVLNAGDNAKVMASWMPDGQRAVVVAEAGDHRRVGVWDRESDETRWLIDDATRNIERAFAPRGCDASLIVVVEVQGARSRALLFDVETGEETPISDLPGDLLPLRPIGDDWWVGIYSSSTQPSDVIRFDLDHLRPDAIESLTRMWERTSVKQEDLAAAEDFRWRSVDGMEIQGWLYQPKSAPRGTILHIHGGPTWHNSDDFDAEVQFLVSEGFNVLLPNYRGSTGFGLAYQEAIKQDGWGGREQDDIRTGIEALIAKRIATPGRVGVTGTSYGGYSSWCQITRCPPELVAASAPICGMTDLVVDYETTRPDLRPYSEEMMGGNPSQVPERYKERSPINFVDQIKGRLLIVQGMRDPNVTPENVRVVTGALGDAGVEYQLLTFDDEGHGIKRQPNKKTLYARLADFFAEAFEGND